AVTVTDGAAYSGYIATTSRTALLRNKAHRHICTEATTLPTFSARGSVAPQPLSAFRSCGGDVETSRGRLSVDGVSCPTGWRVVKRYRTHLKSDGPTQTVL